MKHKCIHAYKEYKRPCTRYNEGLIASLPPPPLPPPATLLLFPPIPLPPLPPPKASTKTGRDAVTTHLAVPAGRSFREYWGPEEEAVDATFNLKVKKVTLQDLDLSPSRVQ